MLNKPRVVTFVLAMLLFSSVGFGADPEVVLCQDGTSKYTIVVNPDANAGDKHAAEEFRDHFKLCTGVELPIAEKSPAGGAPMIVIGRGELAKSLGVNPSAEQLGEQGCLIQTVGKNLVIAGESEVATANGVYRFLEQTLGIRWYAPGVTKTPAAKTVKIAAVERIIRPAFALRNTSFYVGLKPEADFLARVGMKSGYDIDGNCHTYFGFISPEEYFDEHPEYFSEINGARLRDHTQLCLTNPEVLEIVTKKMLKRMEENPNARSHDFSQMDWDNTCRCPSCKAMNEKYGTKGGTQFWFVNQLAERTSKVFPKKLVSTLAYQHTVDPPKGMAMHPNLAIWLCHISPSCDSHPVAVCSQNALYKGWVEQWSKLCKHLFIWHYSTNFDHYYEPYPNFRSLAADVRFYHEHGITGIYFQGMSYPGGGGEFSLLRPWFCMQLAMNPDQNADDLIRDFLAGYYGAAAEPIWQYITLIHDKVDNENIHMDLQTNPAQGYLPDSLLEHADALFDKAEAAVAGDPVLLDRVQVARMTVKYARLFPRDGFVIENQKLRFLGKKGTPADAAAFVEQMKKHGFQNFHEATDSLQPMLMLANLINSQLDVVTLENPVLSVDVVPQLGGRVVRIIHKPTGQCVTSWNVASSRYFPYSGGVVDIAMPRKDIGDMLSWASPTVAEKSDRSVTLDSLSEKGGLLRRTIQLDDTLPVVEMADTITNRSDESEISRPIVRHMTLNLGDVQRDLISFVDQMGQPVMLTIHDLEGRCHGVHMYDVARPKGQWRFSGTKGLELVHSFDTDGLEFAWLRSFPEERNELELALRYKPTTIPPGESVTVRQKIEVVSRP